MSRTRSAGTGFEIGPLVPLKGGDGEAVTAWRERIATLGAPHATWWIGGLRSEVELPNVRVAGARWSDDGRRILAGTGWIDVGQATWEASPAVSGLVTAPPPGGGAVEIRATSWSADARHVAALLAWSGPRPPDGSTPNATIAIVDPARPSASGDAPVEVAAPGASAVRIVGDRVVVAAPTVRAFSFDGTEVAALDATPGTPRGLAGGNGADPVLVFDRDWSIRVVDPGSWSVLAHWPGSFLDAIVVEGGGLIGVGQAGTIVAARLGAGGVEEIGRAETGIGAARLAATGDGRLVILGAGPEPVHTVEYRLRARSG